MDYGKAAYVRAEELERRVNKLGAARKQTECFFEFEPDREIKRGRSLEIGVLGGSGVVTLIVKISATAFDCGALTLNVNGIAAGETEFSFLGKSDGLIMASVRADGAALLALECDDSLFARVHGVSVAAFGADVSFGSSGVGFGADENGGKTGVAYIVNDRLFFATFDSVGGRKLSETEIGAATAADVVRYGESGFAIVFRDGFGGLWGAIADEIGNVTSRTYLGVNGETAAVENFGGNLALAYVRAGKVFVSCTYGGFSGFSGESAVSFGGKCENAGFVKSAGVLTLWAVSAGKILVKRAEKSESAAFGGEVRVKATIS